MELSVHQMGKEMLVACPGTAGRWQLVKRLRATRAPSVLAGVLHLPGLTVNRGRKTLQEWWWNTQGWQFKQSPSGPWDTPICPRGDSSSTEVSAESLVCVRIQGSSS